MKAKEPQAAVADGIDWRDRCLQAERRLARYQVAHCRLLQLVADLCSAECEINYVAMRDVHIKNPK